MTRKEVAQICNTALEDIWEGFGSTSDVTLVLFIICRVPETADGLNATMDVTISPNAPKGTLRAMREQIDALISEDEGKQN